jgi:hypothetical protein
MNDRKETPDILAEMLGNEPQTSPAPTPSKPKAAPPQKKRSTQSSRSTSSRRKKAAPQKWEYQVVSFQFYNGWRPRYINGDALDEWMDGPLIHEYASQLGGEGWELVTASSGERMYGRLDKHQLFFKRAKT